MSLSLDRTERRVVGCLVEKELAAFRYVCSPACAGNEHGVRAQVV